MPLVILTGLPSSGKSTVAEKLRQYLKSRDKEVHIVCETDLLGGLTRDKVFGDSKEEKAVRGRLKSEVVSHLGKENVVICDGLNYIKGFRYELYCASKASKTTQVTIQCDLSAEDCLLINSGREEEGYGEAVLSELVQRYEVPISSNRWDSPLYLVLKDGEVPYEAIYDSLFLRKAPPPNMSTQNKPLSNTNFVYELDKMTAGMIQSVMEGQKSGQSEVGVLGVGEKIALSRHYTLAELSRVKRQFLVYVKQNACQDLDKLSIMFVQYLNSNLAL